VRLQLTTVSLASNFDALISIRFDGQAPGTWTQLIVDSGNSTLIVPCWEAISGRPGYTVLVEEATEPWGCPAKVVSGPIELETCDNQTFRIDDCTFYACTGPNDNGQRTANFGAGRLRPSSDAAGNVHRKPEVHSLMADPPMLAPLAYATDYPFAEFDYAPASQIQLTRSRVTVDAHSSLVLYRSMPQRPYTIMDTIPGQAWMSVRPKSVTTAGGAIRWRDDISDTDPHSPIAMVDSGGGPVLVNDPDGQVAMQPDPVSCPNWTTDPATPCVDCKCSCGSVTLVLENASRSVTYTYTINTQCKAAPEQGLSLVPCKSNYFLFNRPGINIGGLSLLSNYLLIDYHTGNVGLAPK
jgi:hypothetical protein